jgi:hypothetical protein
MPSTDRNLELKAKTSVAQTASQAAVYAKGLNVTNSILFVLMPLAGCSGHYMYRQFNIQQFYVLPTQCIYY